MNRKMAETVSLERNAPMSPAITRKNPALPHRPGLKSYAMRLRRRYKTGLFYERTYPLPFHFYKRFSTPDLLCGQRRPLQNPGPASGRDKRGPPVSSQNRKDSPVFGNATLPYLRKTPAQPPAATSAALPYLRKTAKIRRFPGGPRLSRPGERGGRTRGNAALPYLRKTAKIRRFSGGPRLSRPREGWAASGG